MAGIERYEKLIFPFHEEEDRVKARKDALTTLEVTVKSDDETLQLGVDESYSLSVTQTTSSIQSNTIYGALHGLETFSQLVKWVESSSTYRISYLPIAITDAPRFVWRGLMIDTGRHYLSKATILRTVDALAYNKMNTLHWHMVDAQSFPLEITSYPLLSQKGSYSPHAVFSWKDVTEVIEYAKMRGVRVVPEFDVPGHAASWGKGYNVTATCPSYSSNVNNIPLDPSNELSFKVLTSVLAEAANVFSDKYMHTGGDEVIYGCWLQDRNIINWMNNNKFTGGLQVEQYFHDRLKSIMAPLGKTNIVWQDPFDNGVTINPGTVIEVWKDSATLQKVINKGYNGILAHPYYLDKQSPIGVNHYQWVETWTDFYASDPTANITTNADKILGAEACMWAEQVDSTNFDSRVWPRACGVSERLWSPKSITNVSDARTRLIAFRCLLAQRGIGAGPIEPDYCPLPPHSRFA